MVFSENADFGTLRSSLLIGIIGLTLLLGQSCNSLINQPHFKNAKSNVIIAINGPKYVALKGGRSPIPGHTVAAAANFAALMEGGKEEGFFGRFFLNRLPETVESEFSKVKHWKLIPHAQASQTEAYKRLNSKFVEAKLFEISAKGYPKIPFNRAEVNSNATEALIRYMEEDNIDQVTFLYFRFQYHARNNRWSGAGYAQQITRMFISTLTRSGKYSVFGHVDVETEEQMQMRAFVAQNSEINYEIFENHLKMLLESTVDRINDESGDI